MKFIYLFAFMFAFVYCQETNNNKFMRGVSDTVDKVLPKDSSTREAIHGVWHETVCDGREYKRAKDKFHIDGRTVHLKNFDNTHPSYKPQGRDS